jgi:hypothetical protein
MNTQIANVAAIQVQTKMITRLIDQEIEILGKEVLQSFILSTKAEMIAKAVSERKGNEAQRAISAQDVDWQVQFEELVEEVGKLSKSRHLDAKYIAEVKTRIASHPSTVLSIGENIATATALAPLLSPTTDGHHVRYPFALPLPEYNVEEEGQSGSP